MSGSAPTDDFTWAGSAASSNVVEPTTKRAGGWNPGDEPPAEWLNWLQRMVGRWFTYYGTKNALGGVLGITDSTHEASNVAEGSGLRHGFKGTGADLGYGLYGIGGSGGGFGLYGQGGADGGAGVYTIGGAGDGPGANFSGGGSNGDGMQAGAQGTGIAARLSKGSGATDALLADGRLSGVGLRVKTSGNGADTLSGFIERGTVTPSITDTAGSMTVTYQTQRFFRYTRINGTVFFDFRIDWTKTSGGGANALLITGLPYAIKDRLMTVSSSPITLGNITAIGGYTGNYGGAPRLYARSADSTSLTIIGIDLTASVAGNNFWVSNAMDGSANSWSGWGCYFTDDAF